jgi:hypothetical protein
MEKFEGAVAQLAKEKALRTLGRTMKRLQIIDGTTRAQTYR